jgi:phage terminase small subunit
MRNEAIEYKDRLKASEYIAKTNAAFLDKVELNGKLGVTIVDDLDD